MMPKGPVLLGNRKGHQCPAIAHRVEGMGAAHAAGGFSEHRSAMLGEREEDFPPAAGAVEEAGADEAVQGGAGCGRRYACPVEHADEDARTDRAGVVVEDVFAQEREEKLPGLTTPHCPVLPCRLLDQ